MHGNVSYYGKNSVSDQKKICRWNEIDNGKT